MSNLKEIKSRLASLGFVHGWKLVKDKEQSCGQYLNKQQDGDFADMLLRNTRIPLSQNVDFIIPECQRSASRQQQLEQFLHIVGQPMSQQDSACDPFTTHQDSLSTPILSNDHEFIQDDEQRAYHIQEFIKTEVSYVESLCGLVDLVVRPLRTDSHTKYPILNPFKCTKIFLNIDQILHVNQQFLDELRTNSKQAMPFGDICANYMAKFECYRKYLMEHGEAQKLHGKEFKSNQNYRRLLLKAQDHPQFKKRRLEDIIVEPVQRISRYSMMLKDLLRLTPKSHPDFEGLTTAYKKSQEIASMADDHPTKLATMFLNMYSIIKDSPCSLINQNRALIAHLDALEIHRTSNRVTRAVTLFLFTDKIMIASRPSMECKGSDLCALADTDIITSKKLERVIRKDSCWKFKGWADIEQVEIFGGTSARPASFLLRASSVQQQHGYDPLSTVTSFEKYFHKGARFYSAMVPKEHFGKRETQQTYIQKTRDFIASYQKTQALAKQYDEHDTLYHRQWQKIPVYSNMHSPSTYIKANYKNNIAVLYVEDGTVDFDGLFPNHSAMPWIVALVQPDLRGFRYQISSKVHLERIQQFFKPSSATNQEGQPIDFEMVFWDNILLCERQLRLSPVFSYANDFVTEEEIQKQTRSKATTRSGTLAPFNKLFSSSNSNLQANRTQRDQRRPPPSPIRPVNSTSLPMSTGNTNATRDVSATATWRSAPITQDPYNDTDDTTCSSQSAKTEPEHPAPPKKQRYPLAQLKLPSSSLGEDIASQLRRQSHENLVREYCGVQASHRREDELTITSPSDLNLRRASIISYPSPTTPNFDRPLSYHQPVSSPGPMHWIQNRPGTGDSHLSLANTLSSFTSSLSTNSSAASDDTSITRLAENPDDLVQKLQQLLLTQPIADNRMEQISQTAEKLKVQWKLLSQKHKEMHDYVSELMEKTAKIDGEISIVSNAYNEVYTETCSLYDKFNQELDQLTDLVQPRSTCTTGSKSSLHSEAHEQVSGNTLTLTEKLWEAETEKEHWQQRAMELTALICDYTQSRSATFEDSSSK